MSLQRQGKDMWKMCGWERLVPIDIIDVAGCPGCSKGRGLGNTFLDELDRLRQLSMW